MAANLNCQATFQPEAIKKIKRILDYAEKHQWHDLRKNPEDLPTHEGPFLIRYEWEDGDMDYQTDIFLTEQNKWEGGHLDRNGFVTKWREIDDS